MYRLILGGSLLVLSLSAFAAEMADPDPLAGAPEPLAEALRSLSRESDRWAYTERRVTTDRKGEVKESRLVRFDPSLAPEDRWTLLEEDGQPPSERAQRKFRRTMVKHGSKRIKLSGYLQLDRAVRVREDDGVQVYEVPLRKENNDRLPPEKFQVLVTVRPEPGRLEGLDIVLREAMRVAVAAKVRSGGASIRFESVAPEHGPVVKSLRGHGEGSVLFVKVGGGFTAERSDFKRVTPFDERFQVKLKELNYLDF